MPYWRKSLNVCRHFSSAFAVLGIPARVKTDNGPAYMSQRVAVFFQQWGVCHCTVMPHSPTDQAIVERAHAMLKRLLLQQKGEVQGFTPQKRLNKSLYVFNFLNSFADNTVPPILKHFASCDAVSKDLLQKAKVMFKHAEKGLILGPVSLITWGRGYACVSTDTGPRWIPVRNICPFLKKRPSLAEYDAAELPPEEGLSPAEDNTAKS